MKFGIDLCGVRNKTASAVRDMSDLLASSVNAGAAAFGEIVSPGLTPWHSAHEASANALPRAAALIELAGVASWFEAQATANANPQQPIEIRIIVPARPHTWRACSIITSLISPNQKRQRIHCQKT